MIELSLNQATTRPYPLGETCKALSAKGIDHIGLWLEPVGSTGARATRALLEDNGLSVSSMCRTGFVADKSGAEFDRALDEVRRAIDLSHEVGAPQLTFIAGGYPEGDRDLPRAEARVRKALDLLAGPAEQAGLRLALEPLHPLFVDGRSVVTTIEQGLRVIDGLPGSIGLLIDAYATYWDPRFQEAVARAGSRIAGYQVNDFSLPLPAPEHMNGRLFPGEGVIDLASMTGRVREAGYRGPVEVEIFSDEVWAMPLEQIVDRTVKSFHRAVVEPLEVHKSG